VALDEAEKLVFNVSQRFTRDDLEPIRETLREYIDKLDQLHEHRGTIVGVATGFSDLDKMTGGLQKSDLVILAARPAVGKTAMALSLARNAAMRFNRKIALFSLEMSKEQLAARMLSMDAGVDQQKLRTGYINDEEWDRISESVGRLSEADIYIDDTPGITLVEMRSKARRLMMEHGFDLLIVDYLQLMQGSHAGRGHENRVMEISEISRGLKGIARELNVPVLALSQLSRAVESRTEKKPQLSDLRESGCLTSETPVYLPDLGVYRPIATGHKPVYRLTTRLGRTIRATANHKFRTITGWQRLDELAPGMPIAVSPTPARTALAGIAARASTPMTDGQWHEVEQVVQLAGRDALWDEIVSIEPDGEADVYDLTVDGLHNFVAADIVVHNSIEQDADIVMFIYRDEVYNPDSDRKNIADIIVAKHRNGPIGQVSLYFMAAQTLYRDLDLRTADDE
jgi:replicative DNA helicase